MNAVTPDQAGIGLNVLLGLAGEVSLGQGGFVAIGAYGVGILTTKAILEGSGVGSGEHKILVQHDAVIGPTRPCFFGQRRHQLYPLPSTGSLGTGLP